MFQPVEQNWIHENEYRKVWSTLGGALDAMSRDKRAASALSVSRVAEDPR